MKNVINKKTNDNFFPDSFKYGDKIIKNPEEISDKFNEFFVTIGPKLDAKIDPPRVDFRTYLKNEMKDSLYIDPTTSEEIIDILHECKNKVVVGMIFQCR